MPELPEVHTIIQRIKPLCGVVITDFGSSWQRQLQPSLEVLQRALIGHRISDIFRRGKYMIFAVHQGFMLIHLRMSGRLEIGAPLDGKHVRAWWRFADGRTLVFDDARKFGRITWCEDWRQELAHLGPEPLSDSFRTQLLHDILRRHHRALKSVLLDQAAIAGLGNIYTDEALFRARLHPLTRCDELSSAQVTRLHRAIRHVLRKGIEHNGTSLDWIYPEGNMQQYLEIYGRTGQPCVRCGHPVDYLRVAQRGTHICTHCQPLTGR